MASHVLGKQDTGGSGTQLGILAVGGPHPYYLNLSSPVHDGSEDEFGPGEVWLLPAGHDAWVIGTEPVVVIDITGMATYAKPG